MIKAAYYKKADFTKEECLARLVSDIETMSEHIVPRADIQDFICFHGEDFDEDIIIDGITYQYKDDIFYDANGDEERWHVIREK